MTILARDEFNRTEVPIVGWSKVNSFGDGTMDADAGRAKVNKGASTPPLMQWDATIGTNGGYKFTVVPTTFSRMNTYVHMTDTDNFIMVYTTGGTLGCGVVIGGTQVSSVSIPSITVSPGDTFSVETEVTGKFTRHIIVNVYVNGTYTDYFIIDKDAAIENGACGIQFENIAESHFDDAILEN